MSSTSPKSLTELADQADRALAREAAMKASRGEKISSRERAAMKRVGRALEQEQRKKIYGSIPKKDYLELCGRQAKVINEQARRYGLPLMGRTLDLGAIFRAFHDFLAENSRALAAGSGDDPMVGSNSPELERWRKSRADLAELELEEKRGNLVSREKIHRGLVDLAARLRQFGETLQRDFGADAHRLLEELYDDYQRWIDSGAISQKPEGEKDE